MKPHKQLFKHQPELGIYGDCHRTAIACLLDLHPSEVPHFNHDAPGADEFNRRCEAWLATQGLCSASVAYDGAVELQKILDVVKLCSPGVYFLLGGESRSGVNHTVIGCDGEIVWDPSQRDSGITGPCTEDRNYWVTYLVPIALRKKLEPRILAEPPVLA